MATATLDIHLDAITANWRALDALSARGCETAAVVKADGYGLGAGRVVEALAGAGVRTYFVADASEGAAIRPVTGPDADIAVFSGHMAGDTDLIAANDLIPLLNSPEQFARHRDALPDRRFGIQLDTGMNRLGMEAPEWDSVKAAAMAVRPWLVMSHLACADAADDAQNSAQLATFHAMTDGLDVRRSLAATGGILLGTQYHFDLTRPGIGLFGGAPFTAAQPVVDLTIPVIQCREVAVGETVGYGASWAAARPSRIATVQAGYADGLIRAMSGRALLFAAGHPCPLAGRVSMDMLTVDVTDAVAALGHDPETLQILGDEQGVDALAEAAGTIGYEILTSLGARYTRRYSGATA